MKLQGLPSPGILHPLLPSASLGPSSLTLPSFLSSPTGLPSFSYCSSFLVIATAISAAMMDLSELGEAAAYLRKSYQEMVKVHTVPGDGESGRGT